MVYSITELINERAVANISYMHVEMSCIANFFRSSSFIPLVLRAHICNQN